MARSSRPAVCIAAMLPVHQRDRTPYRAFSVGHPRRARHPSDYDVAQHRLHSIDEAVGPADRPTSVCAEREN
jgi:hypothetical protein